MQIWQYNVCYTNIIAMKDMIIEEKAREKERLSKNIANTTAPVELAQALSSINFTRKYIWAISDADMDAAKELELTSIKKYWRCTRQVEMELD